MIGFWRLTNSILLSGFKLWCEVSSNRVRSATVGEVTDRQTDRLRRSHAILAIIYDILAVYTACHSYLEDVHVNHTRRKFERPWMSRWRYLILWSRHIVDCCQSNNQTFYVANSTKVSNALRPSMVMHRMHGNKLLRDVTFIATRLYSIQNSQIVIRV